MLPEEEHRLQSLFRVSASAIKRHDPLNTETERIPGDFRRRRTARWTAVACAPVAARLWEAQLPAFGALVSLVMSSLPFMPLCFLTAAALSESSKYALPSVYERGFCLRPAAALNQTIIVESWNKPTKSWCVVE
jgi:hypothetical protein